MQQLTPFNFSYLVRNRIIDFLLFKVTSEVDLDPAGAFAQSAQTGTAENLLFVVIEYSDAPIMKSKHKKEARDDAWKKHEAFDVPTGVL